MQRNRWKPQKPFYQLCFQIIRQYNSIRHDIEGSSLHTLKSVVLIFSDGYNICKWKTNHILTGHRIFIQKQMRCTSYTIEFYNFTHYYRKLKPINQNRTAWRIRVFSTIIMKYSTGRKMKWIEGNNIHLVAPTLKITLQKMKSKNTSCYTISLLLLTKMITIAAIHIGKNFFCFVWMKNYNWIRNLRSHKLYKQKGQDDLPQWV